MDEKIMFEKQLEEIKESKKYEELEKLLTEERFVEVLNDLTLFEIVIKQISEIFIQSLYNENSAALLSASRESVNTLLGNFTQQFIDMTQGDEEVAPIPDLLQIVSWIEEIHIDLANQLYNETFVREVIRPAYENVSKAVIETADEIEENGEIDEDGN